MLRCPARPIGLGDMFDPSTWPGQDGGGGDDQVGPSGYGGDFLNPPDQPPVTAGTQAAFSASMFTNQGASEVAAGVTSGPGFWGGLANVLGVTANVVAQGSRIGCGVGATGLCSLNQLINAAAGMPTVSAFPPGTVTTFDSGRWLIAVPSAQAPMVLANRPAGLNGLSDQPRPGCYRDDWGDWVCDRTSLRRSGLRGAGGQLGGLPTHTQVGGMASQPPGVIPVSLTNYQKYTGTLPFYKDWRVWLGLGAVAAAGTGYYLFK